MLAVATHEPHFYVLREVVYFKGAKNKVCEICKQPGHFQDQCQGMFTRKDGNDDENNEKPDHLKPFQFVTISILREYLENDLQCKTKNFTFDIDRVLDDWVFLCFFVGNDFLPHLPTLKIREGAIELLMELYQKTLPTMTDYLTHNGDVCVFFCFLFIFFSYIFFFLG